MTYKSIIAKLCSLLKTSNETFRAKSAHTLMNLANQAKQAVPDLITCLESYGNLPEAISALVEIGKTNLEIIPNLIEIVANRTDALSADILMALAGIGAPAQAVVPHLLAKVQEEWPGRMAAIMALGIFRAEPQMVIRLLSNVILSRFPTRSTIDELLKARALSIVGQYADHSPELAFPVILQVIHETNEFVRTNAISTLMEIAVR